MAKKSHTFAPNDRVSHFKHGLGTIDQIDERYTTIVFDEAGKRKFVTPMVVLEPSDQPEPEKPVRAKKSKPERAAKPAKKK